MTDELDRLIDRVSQISTAPRQGRCLIGIAGGPASGKSTIAIEMTRALNERLGANSAALVSMDGFHMRGEKLRELGLEKEKGAIHTFEADDFVAFVVGLKGSGQKVEVPVYSRELHEVIDAAYVISGEQIVVLEGNYLLDPAEPWRKLREVLDLKIFIDTPRDLCRQRLIERHLTGGKTQAQADAKTDKVDLPNFDRINKTKPCADVVISGAPPLAPVACRP